MTHHGGANRTPVVLVHGYSAGPGAFGRWREILAQHGHAPHALIACEYASLVHRVPIKDLGEGFEGALAAHPRLADGAGFDAIVHSTGMLVLRAWLALDPERNRRRLGRLVALAPATFGSPLAHKGRGYLGRLIVGNRDVGPDFLAVGDEVLDGLELGSRFTWDLAHHDLVGPRAHALPQAAAPYPFVLCGIDGYTGLLGLANEAGTDGTVRLAGTALNTRKIVLDLTVGAEAGLEAERTVTAPWSVPDAPMIALAGLNHGTILSEPSAAAIDLVTRALRVDDDAAFAAWTADARARSQRVLEAAHGRRGSPLGRWQQFVVRVVDERGDGVDDYYLDFVYRGPSQRRWRILDGVRLHVHPYGRDRSLRCFHLDLDTLRLPQGAVLGLRLLASTGTDRVRYRGYASESIVMLHDIETAEERGAWTAAIDLSRLRGIELFHPFTTTLIEMTIDRVPVAERVLRLDG
jgi:hypothetical protein